MKEELAVFQMRLRLIATVFLSVTFAAMPSRAQGVPTISGNNAFWFLGNPGPLSDGAGCGTGGWCFYAQAGWTANANGHSGSPTWTILRPGTGSVVLSCYTCDSTVATATAASEGCLFDINVYVTYSDGAQSGYFNVLINTAHQTTLQPGYPQNSAWSSQPGYTGYQSLYQWTLTDLCGDTMMGTDVNETFGTFYNDYPGTTWPYLDRSGPGTQGYNATANYMDTLEVSGPGNAKPVPQTPRGGNTPVWHDLPWNYWVFSQAYSSGVSIHSDSQQYYQDHGTHSAP